MSLALAERPPAIRQIGLNQWDAYLDLVRRSVRGRSFVDVGGLYGVKGELVTVAAKAGAARLMMADIIPFGHRLWAEFDKRCAEHDVRGVDQVNADVDSADFRHKVGRHDVVACGGILYHCPNPVHTLTQLASIAGDTLIVRTARIPSTIENARGRIELPSSSALFLPSIDDDTRAIMKEYYLGRGDPPETVRVILNEDRTPWWNEQTGTYDYGPWWWGFTTQFIVGLFRAIPFEVLDVLEWPYTVAVRARRRT
jgi:hypothetical protein